MSEMKLKRSPGRALRGLLAPLMAALVLLSACAPSSAAEEAEGRLQVVATTTLLYDMALALGGEHTSVRALMGPGIDPHLYHASARDVTRMQDADVVLYNGLHLEGKMGDIFAALGKRGGNVIRAEDAIAPAALLADESNPDVQDPHIWFDVGIWMDVARHVAARLAEIDPANADDYRANLQAYLDELADLDRYIRARVGELDEEQRVLVTGHDAFRYFGRAYGFEVRGLQGISTEAEAGTGDVRELAAYIAEHRIKAIFVESSVSPKNIEALKAAVRARGFAVELGGSLYSDSLGDEASGHATYVLTYKANIDTIIDALK